MQILKATALIALHCVLASSASSLRIENVDFFVADSHDLELQMSATDVAAAGMDDDIDENRRKQKEEPLPAAMRHAPDLELIVENKFEHLIKDKKGITKWEASAVNFARGAYYVVFDNLHGFAEIRNIWSPSDNLIVGDPGSDSGYEGLAYDRHSETFNFLVESTATHQGQKPMVTEKRIVDKGGKSVDYETLNKCPIHFNIESDNKGLEGMLILNDLSSGSKLLFGLCEGNFCVGGRKGRERGNGRLVIAEYSKNNNECAYDFRDLWELPSHVMFKDYSGIAFDGYRMAITSQEDAMVWIADVDVRTRQFKNEGKFYKFPKDDQGRTVYCNVEGVNFVGKDTIVVVSDKMKGGGRQPAECAGKDQSIHMFTIPDAV